MLRAEEDEWFEKHLLARNTTFTESLRGDEGIKNNSVSLRGNANVLHSLANQQNFFYSLMHP